MPIRLSLWLSVWNTDAHRNREWDWLPLSYTHPHLLTLRLGLGTEQSYGDGHTCADLVLHLFRIGDAFGHSIAVGQSQREFVAQHYRVPVAE